MRILTVFTIMLTLCFVGCSKPEMPPAEPEPEPATSVDESIPWVSDPPPKLIVVKEVEFVAPTSREMQGQDVSGMTLIDDRPKEEGIGQH